MKLKNAVNGVAGIVAAACAAVFLLSTVVSLVAYGFGYTQTDLDWTPFVSVLVGGFSFVTFISTL